MSIDGLTLIVAGEVLGSRWVASLIIFGWLEHVAMNSSICMHKMMRYVRKRHVSSMIGHGSCLLYRMKQPTSVSRQVKTLTIANWYYAYGEPNEWVIFHAADIYACMVCFQQACNRSVT
jgi:hypothetical protein